MLDSLITSKTRVKLLLKFFFNPDIQAYLRGLAEEFNESTNSVRVELNRLSEAGLLESKSVGRTKLYRANKKHPLFPELNSVVKKYLGIDQVVDEILDKLGDIGFAFITGDYAQGKDSGIIDLVIIGVVNDNEYLQYLIKKVEEGIKRKVRVLVLNNKEFEGLKDKLKIEKSLLIWNKDKRK